MAVVITDLGTSIVPGSGLASITTAVDIPAGALVCILYAGVANVIVEDGTNTATLIQSFSVGNGGGMSYFYNYPGMATGGFIEVAANAGTPSIAMSAFFATGIVSATDPLDSSDVTTYAVATTAPTVTITNSTPDCLLVGGLSFDQTSATTYTQASGYSTPFTKGGRTSATTMFVAGGNKIVSASASQTFNPTIGTAGNGGIILAAFKINTAGNGGGNFLSFF